MRAGDLRHRIWIQQRVAGQDATGSVSQTWVNYLPTQIWSEIAPLSGHELVAAQAVQSEVTHTITIRYQAALSDPQTVAGMRAIYGTRIFNIGASMNVDERNRTIILNATEGKNLG